MNGLLCLMSRPARGAWVEISMRIRESGIKASRPARGAWVEIPLLILTYWVIWSRPARGAWVEIKRWAYYTHAHRVAPRKGRVG